VWVIRTPSGWVWLRILIGEGVDKRGRRPPKDIREEQEAGLRKPLKEGYISFTRSMASDSDIGVKISVWFRRSSISLRDSNIKFRKSKIDVYNLLLKVKTYFNIDKNYKPKNNSNKIRKK